MSISVVCPGCSAKLNAPDTAAGKKVKCPKCQGAITVPTPEADFEVVEDEPPAKKPAPAPAQKPKVKAVAEEDDDEDERPRKKKRRDEDEDEEDEKPRKKVKAVAEADDEEDERPRKKKRREAEEEDEEDERPRKKKKKKRGGESEGGVSMTRNIIGAVLLLILLAIAAFVFYDKFKDSDEGGSSSTTTPGATIPPPPGDPVGVSGPKGAGGNPGSKGPRPKQPGPISIGPEGAQDRANARKAALIHGEWLVFWQGGISSLKRMEDAKSVKRECEAIEKHAAEIRQRTADLKALGPIPPGTWEEVPGAVDVTGAKRVPADYVSAVKAAEKRIGALGMPELLESIRAALATLDEANQEFVKAFNAVYPAQMKGNG